MEEKKDGHSYIRSVKAIRKIDDIPELKETLITISESKTHKQMSRYSLLLAKHILEISKVECCSAIAECFDINRKWQNDEAKFQDARQVAFMINRRAREEKDPVKVKVLRAMGQSRCCLRGGYTEWKPRTGRRIPQAPVTVDTLRNWELYGLKKLGYMC